MNRKKLTEKDCQYFAISFCSREFAELFGIFRAGDEDAAQMLGRKRNAYTPWESVVFPHYDTNGNVVDYCLKPDKPEMERQPDGTEKARVIIYLAHQDKFKLAVGGRVYGLLATGL